MLTYSVVPMTDEHVEAVTQEAIKLKRLLDQAGLWNAFTPTTLLVLGLSVWQKAGVTKAQAQAIVAPLLEGLEEGN
jgi:hypothetical protein